jgi:hypothetical protein
VISGHNKLLAGRSSPALSHSDLSETETGGTGRVAPASGLRPSARLTAAHAIGQSERLPDWPPMRSSLAAPAGRFERQREKEPEESTHHAPTPPLYFSLEGYLLPAPLN